MIVVQKWIRSGHIESSSMRYEIFSWLISTKTLKKYLKRSYSTHHQGVCIFTSLLYITQLTSKAQDKIITSMVLCQVYSENNYQN